MSRSSGMPEGVFESKLTDRYQTTVPDPVRRALKLGKRDRIRYLVRPDGAVLMTRAMPPEADDPVLGKVLDFLARDIAAHPAHVQAVGAKLATPMGSARNVPTILASVTPVRLELGSIGLLPTL